mgnify:CR=1 FL=1
MKFVPLIGIAADPDAPSTGPSPRRVSWSTRLVGERARSARSRRPVPGGGCGPGMIPILHCPGVMMPGQFGPISRTALAAAALPVARKPRRRIMSLIGIPPVMHDDRPRRRRPRPRRSRRRRTAAARRSSTRSRPSPATASATVSKTGMPSCVVPPLPGRDARHDLRAVLAARERVERCLRARSGPARASRVSLADPDAHRAIRRSTTFCGGVAPARRPA